MEAPNVSASAVLPIIIGEPKPLIRNWISDLVERDAELTLLAQAASAEEVEFAASTQPPAMILLSQALGSPALMQVAGWIGRQRRQPTLAVFAIEARDSEISRALRVGASGYLTASETCESLVRAVRRLAGGERYFSPDAQGRLAHAPTDPNAITELKPKIDLLTPREIQVLECIAKGMSKKEIASYIGRAPKTVDNHSTNLMNKLDIHDRVLLTLFAIREGLASP